MVDTIIHLLTRYPVRKGTNKINLDSKHFRTNFIYKVLENVFTCSLQAEIDCRDIRN